MTKCLPKGTNRLLGCYLLLFKTTRKSLDIFFSHASLSHWHTLVIFYHLFFFCLLIRQFERKIYFRRFLFAGKWFFTSAPKNVDKDTRYSKVSFRFFLFYCLVYFCNFLCHVWIDSMAEWRIRVCWKYFIWLDVVAWSKSKSWKNSSIRKFYIAFFFFFRMLVIYHFWKKMKQMTFTFSRSMDLFFSPSMFTLVW